MYASPKPWAICLNWNCTAVLSLRVEMESSPPRQPQRFAEQVETALRGMWAARSCLPLAANTPRQPLSGRVLMANQVGQPQRKPLSRIPDKPV